MQDDFIERKIIMAMITSTDFLRRIHPLYNTKYLDSDLCRLMAQWVMEYFDKYGKAPGKEMTAIYEQKMKRGIPEELQQGIGRILKGLSREYEEGDKFNLEYITDRTINHFKEQRLRIMTDEIRGELSAGDIHQAERIATSFAPVEKDDHSIINPFANPVRIIKAFDNKQIGLVEFPKALGKYWNSQFCREGFVALMGHEKIGKTWMLIEVAMKGLRSGCKVAFFQAGDMSENQMIVRLGIRLAGKSDDQRYCGPIYIPKVDCYLNQTNDCNRPERECDFGIFSKGSGITSKKIVEGEITAADLIHLFEENPEYKECHNCNMLRGVPWIGRRGKVNPLDSKEAVRLAKRFYVKYGRRFRLATFPNETLTMSKIMAILESWARNEGFYPDIIIIDYMDILAADSDTDSRDIRIQEDRKWRRARRLSQEYHCLVFTATQADAKSYDRYLLKLDNFSETKTKYAHVTAMYGMNQSQNEKRLGLIRFNELLLREGEFDRESVITILQRLQMGRPILGSYFDQFNPGRDNPFLPFE